MKKEILYFILFALALIVFVETLIILSTNEDSTFRLNAKIDNLEELAVNYCLLTNNQARLIQASNSALFELHEELFVIHDCSRIGK